jgi:hypothetical protein
MLSLSSLLSARSTRLALSGMACITLAQATLFADEKCSAAASEEQAKTVALLFNQAIAEECPSQAKNTLVLNKSKKKKKAKATSKASYGASSGEYAATSGYAKKAKAKPAAGTKKKMKKKDATPATKLAWMVEENPATWDTVAQLATGHFTCTSATPDKRGRIVALLASQNTASAQALAMELWQVDSDSFSDSDMIAFAENGSEAFARELKRMVKSGNDQGSCLPAAYFAFRGYDHGAQRLVQAVEQDLQPETIHQTLMAAKALAKLGQKKHWADAQDRLFEQVIAALKADDLERARAFTLGALCVRNSLERGSAMRISYLEEEAAWYGNATSEELATADQILELIEDLAPVM